MITELADQRGGTPQTPKTRDDAFPEALVHVVESPSLSRDDLADALQAALAELPRRLATRPGEQFPLLAAGERDTGRGAVQVLLLIGALIHPDADERRTAEYLLRHREEVLGGTRSAHKLISAARTAAEMDCRRLRLIELPSGSREEIVDHRSRNAARDTPSVGEAVINYLGAAIAPHRLQPAVAALLADGVPIALHLAERHALNGGTGPSLVAMRSDARPSSRLATHLRGVAGDHRTARSLARMLVGPDAAPLETALLWWVAQGPESHSICPPSVTRRWLRELGRLQPGRNSPAGVVDFADPGAA